MTAALIVTVFRESNLQVYAATKQHHFNDPPAMPGNGLLPEQLLARATSLAGGVGQAYVERRGIPLAIAAAAALCFDSSFGGRPAVLVALRDHEQKIRSVHGRYLDTVRGQNKRGGRSRIVLCFFLCFSRTAPYAPLI